MSNEISKRSLKGKIRAILKKVEVEGEGLVNLVSALQKTPQNFYVVPFTMPPEILVPQAGAAKHKKIKTANHCYRAHMINNGVEGILLLNPDEPEGFLIGSAAFVSNLSHQRFLRVQEYDHHARAGKGEIRRFAFTIGASKSSFRDFRAAPHRGAYKLSSDLDDQKPRREERGPLSNAERHLATLASRVKQWRSEVERVENKEANLITQRQKHADAVRDYPGSIDKIEAKLARVNARLDKASLRPSVALELTKDRTNLIETKETLEESAEWSEIKLKEIEIELQELRERKIEVPQGLAAFASTDLPPDPDPVYNVPPDAPRARGNPETSPDAEPQ